MITEKEIGGDGTPERRVDELVRELVHAINTSDAQEREALRDVAVGLLREEVVLVEPQEADSTSPPASGSFNPFGIGIPLSLIGLVLVFLFPPVGLAMFAAAAVMIAWGVGATLLARS